MIKQIIVIEESDGVRETLRLLIESYSKELDLELDVHLFSQASDFLAYWIDSDFIALDLLISDIGVGGISGFELLKELRAMIPKTFYVIISKFEDQTRAMELGADYFISTPIIKNEIELILKQI